MYCDNCECLIDGLPLEEDGMVFCSDGCLYEHRDAQQEAAIMTQEMRYGYPEAAEGD